MLKLVKIDIHNSITARMKSLSLNSILAPRLDSQLSTLSASVHHIRKRQISGAQKSMTGQQAWFELSSGY
jgi:hypothetical protein